MTISSGSDGGVKGRVVTSWVCTDLMLWDAQPRGWWLVTVGKRDHWQKDPGPRTHRRAPEAGGDPAPAAGPLVSTLTPLHALPLPDPPSPGFTARLPHDKCLVDRHRLVLCFVKSSNNGSSHHRWRTRPTHESVPPSSPAEDRPRVAECLLRAGRFDGVLRSTEGREFLFSFYRRANTEVDWGVAKPESVEEEEDLNVPGPRRTTADCPSPWGLQTPTSVWLSCAAGQRAW
ncbi:uncharacterized protein LOC116664773 [Camelus ferus]|uniref:Uncharacterized protein LOC116664773 n=1 Tax=Camelus ferus TaxID=419612 RepID=A0A8B8T9Q2_CAMFR|nr:uncharacterized protein LOC116664773 [Camelus ferus]